MLTSDFALAGNAIRDLRTARIGAQLNEPPPRIWRSAARALPTGLESTMTDLTPAVQAARERQAKCDHIWQDVSGWGGCAPGTEQCRKCNKVRQEMYR